MLIVCIFIPRCSIVDSFFGKDGTRHLAPHLFGVLLLFRTPLYKQIYLFDTWHEAHLFTGSQTLWPFWVGSSPTHTNLWLLSPHPTTSKHTG